MFLVLRDQELSGHIQGHLQDILSIGAFTCEHTALEILEDHSPSALVVEWSLKCFNAVDFLIRLSELTNWGDMRVFFVAEAPLTDDDILQMATLGTDQCFQRADVMAGGIGDEFFDTLLEACATPPEMA